MIFVKYITSTANTYSRDSNHSSITMKCIDRRFYSTFKRRGHCDFATQCGDRKKAIVEMRRIEVDATAISYLDAQCASTVIENL